jgi:hypothetical protein
MGIDDAYRTANQWREGELTRLFQRVNYFLIGTAFLVAPLVALFLSPYFLSSWSLLLLASLLILVGFGVSIVFTFSNYLNDRIIRMINKYIKDIENKTNNDFNFVAWLFYNASKNNLCLKQFIKAYFDDFLDSIRHPSLATNPDDQKHGRAASLTWILPFMFMVFWFLMFLGLVVVKILYW